MAEIDIQIAALKRAIAQGAKKVVFHEGGTRREVEYHSLKDMMAALDRLEAEQQRGKSRIILAAI